MTTSENYYFPDPETSDEHGLLAIGGDLHPNRILAAYRSGIFPWFNPNEPILWWSPNPRLILEPQNFKISRSLRKSLKKPWKFSINSCFKNTIYACAQTKGRANATWITKEMLHAYCELNQMGYAHSIEVWLHEQLVGGLYGISLGRAFFGESMFHTITDASKIALFYLCQLLYRAEFHFIDCQIPTAHLQSLGAQKISRNIFLNKLKLALAYSDENSFLCAG